MRDDPIVEEIRKIRREHTDKFGGDLHAICEDLRHQEKESGREYVSFPPRKVSEEFAESSERK
ncbi:MAG: hypothetical protein H6752_00505 [Candidatus Omnitrophica bacterium]|nr:hypothetical protein [Candidatus Omnitrophota bacterium]